MSTGKKEQTLEGVHSFSLVDLLAGLRATSVAFCPLPNSKTINNSYLGDEMPKNILQQILYDPLFFSPLGKCPCVATGNKIF
jgi:hypothetical protein